MNKGNIGYVIFLIIIIILVVMFCNYRKKQCINNNGYVVEDNIGIMEKCIKGGNNE